MTHSGPEVLFKTCVAMKFVDDDVDDDDDDDDDGDDDDCVVQVKYFDVHVQSSRHIVLVVHESTQDAQVHHLEELQVADSEAVHRGVNYLLHWTDDLHDARSHDAQHIQLVVSAVRRDVYLPIK